MTPEQRQLIEWRDAGMSRPDIAQRLGVSIRSVKDRLSRAYAAQRREQQDPAILASMDAVGTGMTPRLAWAKTKAEDGTSYSVLLKPEDTSEDALERIREAFEGMEPSAPVTAPERVSDDLCTVYPVMDLHFGMQAWSRETGGPNYSTKEAAADMRYAFEKVLALTPPSREAVLLLGGDALHADDDTAQTPQSKHALDVDGRQYKVIEEAIASLVFIVSRLLSKHENLTIRVLRGNHDTHSHMVLTFALAERYRMDDRVSVERDPRDIYMKQWGRVLISAHHGDKAPPERLTLYLSDVCPYWSDTRHRYCFVGHRHHDHAKDVGPLRWEQLRAFCPPDSYASGMGFSSRRALQALTFCKTDGLVLRAIDPIERVA